MVQNCQKTTHTAIYLRTNNLKSLKIQIFGQKRLFFFAKMAKNRTFLKMNSRPSFLNSTNIIQFGQRNCKNLKRVLQFNWNILKPFSAVVIQGYRHEIAELNRSDVHLLFSAAGTRPEIGKKTPRRGCGPDRPIWLYVRDFKRSRQGHIDD